MSIPVPTNAFSAVPRGGAVIQSPFGVLAPPGSRIAAYVRSGGVQDGDDPFIMANLVTTLNAALSRCRSGQGDVVYVLPGHEENLSAADALSNLVAGTKIVGIGQGASRPTLTWSAATASLLLNVADVSIQNMVLELAGDPSSTTALTVAAPITVSAAGCSIIGCDINGGVDGDQKVTIGITTTAAANDFAILDCHVYSATAAEATTFIRVVGGSRLRIANTIVQGATSSTSVGVVQFLTTAPTQAVIEDCVFVNRKAASISAFTGMAAATGTIRRCGFGILDNATLAGLTVPGSLQGFQNRTANQAGEQGAATTPISA